MTPLVQRAAHIPQQGHLVIWATGGVPALSADYVIVQADELKTLTRAKWLVTWCRGLTCHHNPTHPPCPGHPDWTPETGSLLGDHMVIGAKASGSRALYVVEGRAEWSAYRLRRRA